jgi:uncharacterized protein YjbJ (UPF0337 family)
MGRAAGGSRERGLVPLNFSKESDMNWDQVKGDWKRFSGKIKEKWGKLTDDELTTVAGQRDQVLGLLQKRYGIAKEEAEKQLNDLCERS